MMQSTLSGYFDYNATSPLWPSVYQELLENEYWANPSSLYQLGAKAQFALEASREVWAHYLNTDPASIVFTSGATENAHTVFYALYQLTQGEGRVGISVLEHSCVWQAAKKYFPKGVKTLPVLANGLLDLVYLEHYLKAEQPHLVVCLAAHNVWGTLQPWQVVQSLCKHYGTLCFVDAVQWVGRYPGESLGLCDFLSISSHKIGGPRGVGILKIPYQKLDALLFPGTQENGWRAGTECVAAIKGSVTALQENEAFIKTELDHRIALKKRVHVAFQAECPQFQLIGDLNNSLWNTLTYYTPGHPGLQWLHRLDRLGFQIGVGAACGEMANLPQLSDAIQLPRNFSDYQIRLSSHWRTTEGDWLDLLSHCKALLKTDVKPGII